MHIVKINAASFALYILFSGILFLFPIISYGQPAEAGYRKLDSSQSTYFDVLYFFWYGSPNSIEFTSGIEEWKRKNSAVKFQTIPLTFKDDFIPHSQIFYALDEVGRADLNPKVMLAIHTQGKRLLTDPEIGAWAESQGLNKDEFLSKLHSDSVANKVNQAILLGKRFSISGVPSFVVDGQYVTNPSIAGSNKKFFEVLSDLTGGNAKKTSPKNLQNDPINQAKEKCSEIGFKSGTEVFAKCVLRLSNQ